MGAKLSTLLWAVYTAIWSYGTIYEGATFTEINILAPIMTVLYAYLGFA